MKDKSVPEFPKIKLKKEIIFEKLEADDVDQSFLLETREKKRMSDSELAARIQYNPTLRHFLQDLESDRELREWLAKGIFFLLIFLCIALIIVLASNSHLFKISDEVLKFFIGGIVLKVIGLVLLIVKGLFIKTRSYRPDR